MWGGHQVDRGDELSFDPIRKDGRLANVREHQLINGSVCQRRGDRVTLRLQGRWT